MPMEIYITCIDSFQRTVPLNKNGVGQLYIPKYWYELMGDPLVRVQVLLLPREDDAELVLGERLKARLVEEAQQDAQQS